MLQAKFGDDPLALKSPFRVQIPAQSQKER